MPLQQILKQLRYAWQIRSGRFRSPEPEFDLLHDLLSSGDWVIDVGANVGHYTVQFAHLVAPAGRVVAIEPVPETFALLASNVAGCSLKNVTLVNAAASDGGTAELVGVEVPDTDAGQANYYQAHLTKEGTGLHVLSLPIDMLGLSHRIRLVKIDAEGHEARVLEGMADLVRRDRPTIIVEASSQEFVPFLTARGYNMRTLPGSPNWIFTSDCSND
jgi:FkbM family methyltransferase